MLNHADDLSDALRNKAGIRINGIEEAIGQPPVGQHRYQRARLQSPGHERSLHAADTDAGFQRLQQRLTGVGTENGIHVDLDHFLVRHQAQGSIRRNAAEPYVWQRRQFADRVYRLKTGSGKQPGFNPSQHASRVRLRRLAAQPYRDIHALRHQIGKAVIQGKHQLQLGMQAL